VSGYKIQTVGQKDLINSMTRT